jgi:hypothetical protein
LLFEISQLIGLSETARSLAVRIGRIVVSMTVFALIAYPFGSAFTDRDPRTTYITDLTREVTTMSSSTAYALTALIPALITAYIAANLGTVRTGYTASRKLVPLLALMIAVAAPWNNNGAGAFVVGLPLWLLTLFLVAALLRRMVKRSSTAMPSGRASNLLALALSLSEARSFEKEPLMKRSRYITRGVGDRSPSARRSIANSVRYRLPRLAGVPNSEADHADPGKELLALGSGGGSWLTCGRRAAAQGSVIGAVFVAYFTWAAAGQLNESTDWSTGLLLVVISLATEAIRWIALSFIFGALYRLLPGRIGPLKAASLSAIWIAGAVLPFAVARVLGGDSGQQLIYRATQTVLFLVALAIIYDLVTLRAAGGSWRQLRELYNLESYGQVIASVAPILVLGITLAQQVISGSGFDVATSFVNGLSSLIKP